MEKLGLMLGLVLLATGCGEASADRGEMVLPCDSSYLTLGQTGAFFVATATAEELSGPFTAFYCDYVDQGERPVELPDPCDGLPDCPSQSRVACRMAPAETISRLEDGSYWFACGSTGTDNRPTTVRILY